MQVAFILLNTKYSLRATFQRYYSVWFLEKDTKAYFHIREQRKAQETTTLEYLEN